MDELSGRIITDRELDGIRLAEQLGLLGKEVTIKVETFKCVCGEKFDNLPDLQAHWTDPERDKTRPHYRDMPGLKEKNEFGRAGPPFHKDGPQ